MARENTTILDTGDFFPDMDFLSVQGERIVLPVAFKQKWNVFLFYRGHW